MPDNKSLDGIKKLSGQDLKKARDVVLQSIGEKSKVVKPVNSINNEEADKIEAATAKFKPKQVDGILGRRQTLRQAPSNSAGRHENNETRKHKNTETRKHKNTETRKHLSAEASAKEDENTETRKSPPASRSAGLWRAGKNTLLRRSTAKANKRQRQDFLSAGRRNGGQAKTQKRTLKFWLGKRKANTQSRLLITSYLLLILTLIIIVGSVGFFIILYNLNNYAVLTKAGKVKQMMESGANFYQIAKIHGDEFSVGKYYTYNEAAVKFGRAIVNLKTGQINIIRDVDIGYYLVQCYGKREKLIGLKHIFIKDKNLYEYVGEAASGLWAWNLVD